MRKPYTPNDLRALAKQSGPQWEGEVRVALVFAADLLNAADLAVKSAQPSQATPRVPMTELEKGAAWLRATIDLPSPENCYLRGLADAESHHGVGVEP